MKMQNVELEFVTFEAQDILTSSLSGKAIYALGSTFNNYNENVANKTIFTCTWLGTEFDDDSMWFFTPVKNDGLPNAFYRLLPDYIQQENINSMIDQVKEKSGYDSVLVTNDMEAITQWLKANSFLQ